MMPIWGKLPYRYKMALGLALAFLLFMGMTFLVFQGVSDYMISRQRLTQINQIQLKLDALYSALQEAESSQRGFVITGNEAYLAPYDHALQRLPHITKKLERLTADDPPQRQRIAQVEQLMQIKLQELSETIRLRRVAGMQVAADLVRTGFGKHTMDKIQAVMGEIQAEQNQQQHSQALKTDRNVKYMLDMLNLSRVMAFVFLLGLYLLIYKEAIQRAQAEHQLQQNNDNLEQIVAQRTAELKQSNEELEQFAFVASHDLQAPLRKIKMFAELLKEDLGTSLSDSAQDYFARIDKSVQRMQDLIVDLLAVSRITRKGASFRMVDLHQLAAETVDELAADIEKSEGQIELGSLCHVEADPEQMRQLLSNLVGNALKYHQPGVAPRVKICAEMKDANTCELVVQDNGIGISQEYFERIFEIFQRLHGSQYEGNGIGLSIVKRIVERHGGKVNIDSEPGQGSRFIVQLPVHHAVG